MNDNSNRDVDIYKQDDQVSLVHEGVAVAAMGLHESELKHLTKSKTIPDKNHFRRRH